MYSDFVNEALGKFTHRSFFSSFPLIFAHLDESFFVSKRTVNHDPIKMRSQKSAENR